MNPMAAVKAYQSIQGGAGVSGAGGAAETQGTGFADLLQNVMGDMTQTTKVAEGQMTQLAQGTGSLIDVVTAVSSAEASLETVIAVRDQVIQAYQEIMRMPI